MIRLREAIFSSCERFAKRLTVMLLCQYHRRRYPTNEYLHSFFS